MATGPDGSEPLTGDTYRPLQASDVADDNPQMLAQSIRLLRGEMKDGFRSMVETFGDKIMPALERIESRMTEYDARFAQLERSVLSLKDRVAAVERRPSLPVVRTVTRRPRKR